MKRLTQLEKSIKKGIDRIIEGNNSCRLVAGLIQRLPEDQLAIFEFLEVNLIRGKVHLFERFGYKHATWWTLREVAVIHKAGIEIAEQVLKIEVPQKINLYEKSRDQKFYASLIDARFGVGFLEEVPGIKQAFDNAMA
jgi:hypothetical protein